MALVILSADAVSFIIFWELMSLSSIALVGSHQKEYSARKAALIYLGATRIATGFLALGFIWMHAITQSWHFADWHFNSQASYLPALLMLCGFCIKAGIWPFHIWLPYAHPAAPAPVSALMSGVMIEIACYGVIRLLVLGHLNCLPLAYLILFLGLVSAFWGALFALVQNNLKHLLAYSSVENMGLIFIAIGVVILSGCVHIAEIAALALVGAIFHCLNHSLFKSLLFLGAGSVDSASGTHELEHLGGLAKTMPWTMVSFFVASVAICSLPPLTGFAGKWLIYQSLFKNLWLSHSLVERGLSLIAICILAVVGGLCLAGFTKAVGMSFLGKPRSKFAAQAREEHYGMIAAQLILCACTLILIFIAPQVLALIAPIAVQVFGTSASVQASMASAQMPAGIIFLSLVLLIYAFFLRSSRIKRYDTWDCGYGYLPARAQAVSESFTQPFSNIFSPILQYKVTLEITGVDRRHFPEHIKIKTQMQSVLEKRFYKPGIYAFERLAKTLGRFQAGSIHLYLLYVCFTLALLLLLGSKL